MNDMNIQQGASLTLSCWTALKDFQHVLMIDGVYELVECTTLQGNLKAGLPMNAI